MVEEVIHEGCSEISREILKICYFSENIIINFLADAIKMERRSEMDTGTIKQMLREGINERPGDLNDRS